MAWLVVFLVLHEGGEGGGNEEGEGGEEEGDENGDDEITDLDILLRKEREREKKRKVEDPLADEVGSAINRVYLQLLLKVYAFLLTFVCFRVMRERRTLISLNLTRLTWSTLMTTFR